MSSRARCPRPGGKADLSHVGSACTGSLSRNHRYGEHLPELGECCLQFLGLGRVIRIEHAANHDLADAQASRQLA